MLPEGSEVNPSLSATVIVNDCVADVQLVFVAVKVTLYVPGVEGVPVTVPLLTDNHEAPLTLTDTPVVLNVGV